jgi:hypothetical protein
MYQPKFCAECSTQIIRLHWHFWTSRKFCERCSPVFRKGQVQRLVVAGAAMFLLGMAAGRAARQTPPPVVIQRHAGPARTSSDHTSAAPESTSNITVNAGAAASAVSSATEGQGENSGAANGTSEEVYICGARTKKGTPCSRRVHAPVRCWQHVGLPAILPAERLRIKNP